MAKKAWIERNKRKQATVAKYAALRAELKAKGADVVLLSDDVLHMDPAKVRNVHVLKTFVGGKVVFETP